MRFFFSLFFVFPASIFLAAPELSAHRVNIFAYADGNEILVECGFNRGNKVKGGIIEAADALTGETLVRGTTDANGIFRFSIPEKIRLDGHDIRVQVNAGEGHQNSWVVSAADFASAGETEARKVTPPESTGLPPERSAVGISREDLEKMINSALDAKLAPLKNMLAEQFQSGPGLTEIVGGIGWLIGLAGIAAYCKRRG
jgi:nickel transport protein